MTSSSLFLQRVSAFLLALSCAAVFSSCIWVPRASGQSAYSVSEPAAPKASQAVGTHLAEAEKLQLGLQRTEALKRADLAKAVALESGDRPGEALSQSARATSLVALGRNLEAAAAWQESAAAWERAGDGPSQIEPLVSAALQLWTSDNAGAQQLLTRALKVAKVERQRRFAASDELERAAARLQVLAPMPSRAPAGAGEFHSIAISVRHEAKVGKLLDEDKYPEAETLARTRLAEVEAESGADSLETARALDVLANALFVVKVAEIQEKRQLAERALAIREKALAPEDLDVAQSQYTLARVLWQAGEFRDAKSYWERALGIREKELGPDHAAVRIILANLAAVLADMGDCSAALPLAERFSALVEKAYGPDHPFFGRSLNVVYRAHYCSHNFTDARRVTERALAIKEKAWGAENASVASDRVNLGQLLWEIGDLTEARRNYELALPVLEKLYGAESVFYADGLTGLARVAASAGDDSTARTLQERVVTIYEKALGPNHSDLGMPLINLAATLTREGQPIQARQLYERALSLMEQSRGSESPFVAVALSQLAGLLQETGDTVSAKQLYERALAIQEKTFGANHVTVARTLRGLAQIQATNGETKEAFALALRSEKIGRENWQLIAPTLSEREALAYAQERTSELDLALTLMEEGQTARSAWGAVVRSRALVLDEMATRHRTIFATANPELAGLTGALTAARERQAHLVVQGPGKERPELYRSLLENTRQQKERAERELAEQSQPFRELLAREQIGLNEVTGSLPSNAALVAYVRYGHHDFRPTKPGSQRPQTIPHYLAFVWRHSQTEPEILRLGPAATIETLVTTLRQKITQESRAGGRQSKRSEAAYREAGVRLRRAVWDPVLLSLGNEPSVFIVPDGALHLLNFSALPMNKSRYLIEGGRRLHYLAAERDLVPHATQSGEGLLALGAPDFDDVDLFAGGTSRLAEPQARRLVAGKSVYRGQHSACGDFQSLHFEPLPASARETEEVAVLWRKSADERGTARLRGTSVAELSGVIRLRGSDASEAAFKEQAEGKRVLHLATHGFFLAGQCTSATDNATKSRLSMKSGSVVDENPLLLSGLAFAGANHRQSAGLDDEDGILTAEEIASLDLRGTEWAVLSACDTGVGEVKTSEGVLGLRRAFQVAGAHTLIMSLWAVEDQATRAWMLELYHQRLVEHRPTIDSVYQASLKVLRERRTKHLSTHPFYWAGFVAAGDWR